MITAAKLRIRTVKDLAAMAKKKKVLGWHSMRKDELVKALVKSAKTDAAKRKKRVAAAVDKAAGNGVAPSKDKPKKPLTPQAKRQLSIIKKRLAEAKNLTFKPVEGCNGKTKDRLVVMVRDAYWLHAYWELTSTSVDRAKAAMGQYWHGAKPMLRVCEVERNGTTSTASRVVRDIEIHGGVNNWYVDVQDSPKTYQMDIGYLAVGDKFFSIARSNAVTTPPPGGGDAFDENWAEVAKDFDRVYAMSGGYVDRDSNQDLKDIFEEQLRRPMGDPMTTKFGLGAANGKKRDFDFQVDTELIIHGTVSPDARVTLKGEPVTLRPDGSFAIRFTLPNRRHVLPVVASSGDGVEQRTIVLAVDRNTKVMEPVIRDPSV